MTWVHVVAQGSDETSARSLRGTVKAAATEQSRGDETHEVEPGGRTTARAWRNGGSDGGRWASIESEQTALEKGVDRTGWTARERTQDVKTESGCGQRET